MQITLGNSHKRELADPIDGGLTLQKILRVKKMLEERERHCATQNLTATEVRTRLEEQWLRDPLLDATIEAVQKRIRNFQQQKENSNMPVNEQQPEYSKNCAIKTLQQQLERAEENAKATLGNVNFYQNEKHCYEKKENEWRERLGADEKNVKEIKAALKKLGAGPRIITK